MSFFNRNIIEQELDNLQNNEAFQSAVSNIKAGKFVRMKLDGHQRWSNPRPVSSQPLAGDYLLKESNENTCNSTT